MVPKHIEATKKTLPKRMKNLVARSNHNFGQIQTAITVHVVDAEKKSHLRI